MEYADLKLIGLFVRVSRPFDSVFSMQMSDALGNFNVARNFKCGMFTSSLPHFIKQHFCWQTKTK